MTRITSPQMSCGWLSSDTEMGTAARKQRVREFRPSLWTPCFLSSAGIRYLPYIVISVVATIPILALTSAIGEGIQDNRALAAGALIGLAVFLITPLVYIVLRKKRASPREAP